MWVNKLRLNPDTAGHLLIWQWGLSVLDGVALPMKDQAGSLGVVLNVQLLAVVQGACVQLWLVCLSQLNLAFVINASAIPCLDCKALCMGLSLKIFWKLQWCKIFVLCRLSGGPWVSSRPMSAIWPGQALSQCDLCCYIASPLTGSVSGSLAAAARIPKDCNPVGKVEWLLIGPSHLALPPNNLKRASQKQLAVTAPHHCHIFLGAAHSTWHHKCSSVVCGCSVWGAPWGGCTLHWPHYSWSRPCI